MTQRKKLIRVVSQYIEKKYRHPIMYKYMSGYSGEIDNGVVWINKGLSSPISILSTLFHELGHIIVNKHHNETSHRMADIKAETFSLLILIYLGFISHLDASERYLLQVQECRNQDMRQATGMETYARAIASDIRKLMGWTKL